MKILFYKYGSICEPDLTEQFEKMGLTVVTVDNEVTDKAFTAAQRVEAVNRELSKGGFLFVFSINFFPSISDLCEIYKVPYVGWVVDAPVLELFTKQIANSCNRIFCFDYKQYTEVAPLSRGGVFHLPLGTNVQRWDSVIHSITPADKARFSGDISFVGSLYTEKDPYLSLAPSEELAMFEKDIYGRQKETQGANIITQALTDALITELKEKLPEKFVLPGECLTDMDRFIASNCIMAWHCSSRERVEFLSGLSERFSVDLYTRSPLPKEWEGHIRVKGGVSTLTEMPKVFHLSKINLNMTIHSIETGASLRVWDILGCGGFLLTNYQPELENYLVPGEDYEDYTCEEELTEKCAFYLAHDALREKIARSGYEKTKAYHNYENRFPLMFEQILKTMM